MKKLLLAGKAILGAGLIIIFLNACKNETKQEDPKEVAEDANEAKFDSIESKEDDSDFLVDQAEINLAEIEIGKLAQQKSANSEVKKFGKMLVDEHTKSASEVSALAKAKNFTLPTSLTEEGQEEYNKLNEKSGIDFDKKFADMMIDGHEKAIDKLKKASEKATDNDIKLWASNNIAGLTAHLEHAKMLKQNLEKK
jgi:putative membrane protein